MGVKTILKWGLLLGIATALGTQILTWLGFGLTNWFVLLTYMFVIAFVLLGMKDYKHQGTPKFNFLNAALITVGIILIARLIFQFYMFIYIHYIDPNWVDTVVTTWTATLEESKVAADTISQQMEGFRKSYETLPMFTSSLILYAIPQFILGMIVAFIYVFVAIKKT